MRSIRAVYDWFGTKVHTPHACWWLVGLFFIESSFFFVPVDPLLILFCLEHKKRSIFFATIATIASVVGGIFGYCIGWLLWDSIGISIVRWIISEGTFAQAVNKYTLYQAWAVFIAGFTPVPYKAVTISAGFCKLPLVPFIFYSTISRGLRFFLVAGSIYVWGDHIKIFIEKYFNYLVIVFTIVLILSCSVLKGAL